MPCNHSGHSESAPDSNISTFDDSSLHSWFRMCDRTHTHTLCDPERSALFAFLFLLEAPAFPIAVAVAAASRVDAETVAGAQTIVPEFGGILPLTMVIRWLSGCHINRDE